MKKIYSNDAFAMVKKSIGDDVLDAYSLYGKGEKLSLMDLEFTRIVKDAYDGKTEFTDILKSVLKSARNQRYYEMKG